jgi:hypothetical protein
MILALICSGRLRLPAGASSAEQQEGARQHLIRERLKSEIVAGPVLAILVGSIGLIAAVPVTTALAALLALHLPERRLRAEQVHAH